MYLIKFFGYHPCVISWSVITWRASLVSPRGARSHLVDTALSLSAWYLLITVMSAVTAFH